MRVFGEFFDIRVGDSDIIRIPRVAFHREKIMPDHNICRKLASQIRSNQTIIQISLDNIPNIQILESLLQFSFTNIPMLTFPRCEFRNLERTCRYFNLRHFMHFVNHELRRIIFHLSKLICYLRSTSLKNLNRDENIDANEIFLLKERYLDFSNGNNNESDDESDNESEDSGDAESVFSNISEYLGGLQFTPIEETDSHSSQTTSNSITTRNSQRWQKKIVYRLKEAFVQSYMWKDSSLATHQKVYQLIRTYSGSNNFPHIDTYRKFRFNMYMDIMDDARSGLDRARVFGKWKEICNFDMEPCEKDYLRSSFQYLAFTK